MSLKPFSTPQAFEVLFKEYFLALVNFINKYIDDIELSRDIIQNTFLKLWKNRDKIEIQTSVKSYLYQIAKNTMLDYIRAEAKKKTENLDSIEVEVIEDISEEVFDAYLVRSLVEHSLKSVKSKQREIFILNKFEGLSYDEIATYLNISKRMVDYNVNAVMKHLKEDLKDRPELFN
ncbi:MAG: sigma-70 family RNA polymerase sigma factor [Chitinophagales bacterium]|nr:sigma-70 family RNA polymerase sigma factor [Chitinophagales bacterium]